MRMPIRIVCLAVVFVSSACGSDDAKPTRSAKGTATVTFDGCPYNDAAIYGADSPPTLNDYGAAVANGNGYKVSCSMQGASLQAHIESSSMSLDVASSDGSNAQMIFYVAGTGGTPETIRSVDANNNLAHSCALTTSRSDTLLTSGSGTIFAEYSCSKVIAASNLATVCQTKGLFYFTSCGG